MCSIPHTLSEEHGEVTEQLKTKLRGLSPRANSTTERPPLVGEVSGNFCG
jgi:hypothetical protein